MVERFTSRVPTRRAMLPPEFVLDRRQNRHKPQPSDHHPSHLSLCVHTPERTYHPQTFCARCDTSAQKRGLPTKLFCFLLGAMGSSSFALLKWADVGIETILRPGVSQRTLDVCRNHFKDLLVRHAPIDGRRLAKFFEGSVLYRNGSYGCPRSFCGGAVHL